jgi:hypothetical protein
MDNLAEHGIAGMVGLLFNGFFAADYIIGLDGVSTGLINGGFINHNWKQLYIQLAYVVACTAYSFVVSAGIAFLINLIPGLKLRASEEEEFLGMDDAQLGEFAYDYVEVRRDYLAWTPEHDGRGQDKERMELRSPMSQSQLIEGRSGDIEMIGIANGGMRGDRDIPYEGINGVGNMEDSKKKK